MPTEKLDFIFPFVVFFYGVLIVFVTEAMRSRGLLSQPMAAERKAFVESLTATVNAHRPLAWICFWVGGFWSLQNLIY